MDEREGQSVGVRRGDGESGGWLYGPAAQSPLDNSFTPNNFSWVKFTKQQQLELLSQFFPFEGMTLATRAI